MSDIKAINARSTMLGKVSKANDKAIHDHCVVIADHINGAGNGDVTAADFLCKALSSGLRVNLVREWFLTYAGCSWNADKKQFGKRKAGTFTYNRAIASENPWFLIRPEKEFKPFDLEKFLQQALTKAKAALADQDPTHKHTVSKDMLNKLEALLVDKPAAFVSKDVDAATPVTMVEAVTEAVSVH